MSQKRIRIRDTGLPSLPYWRSIFASSVLLLALMLSFEAVSDPRSGELKSPAVVAPVFGLFVLAEAAVFYAEFRLRRRHPPSAHRTRRMFDKADHAR
jgi:hypothetical protein